MRGPLSGRRAGAPPQSARSIVAALALTFVLLSTIGLTARQVRRAPAPAVARERVEYVAVAAPDVPRPLPPPPRVPDEAPPLDARVRAPSAPPRGPASTGGLPRAPAADSGASASVATDARAAEVQAAIRRAAGASAPSALSAVCARLSDLSVAGDSNIAGGATAARRTAAGCPPPTVEEVRAAQAAAAAENARALAAAMRAAARAGSPGAGSAGAGVSLGVGLPGGGPSNASRRRDRIIDADVTARLKRIREQGEARLRARADSAARADSVRSRP